MRVFWQGSQKHKQFLGNFSSSKKEIVNIKNNRPGDVKFQVSNSLSSSPASAVLKLSTSEISLVMETHAKSKADILYTESSSYDSSLKIRVFNNKTAKMPNRYLT